MFKSFLFLTFVCSLLAFSSAQVVFQGSCPKNIAVVENFNVEKYLGKWHEYAKYPVFFENNGKCIKAEYSLRDDGLVGVKNSMVNVKSNADSFIEGNATLVENAKLLVKFPVPSKEMDPSNYWVLDTDYENYSVVFDCTKINKNEHQVTVWILTRQAFPEPKFIKKAIEVLKNNNISLNELELTNHLSCNEN